MVILKIGSKNRNLFKIAKLSTLIMKMIEFSVTQTLAGTYIIEIEGFKNKSDAYLFIENIKRRQ